MSPGPSAPLRTRTRWNGSRMTHLPFRRLFAAFGLAAMLAASGPPHYAEGATETIERIEPYLTSLRTIESDFVQSSSGGDFSRGRLYVARPNNLRLDYEPPSTMQIYVTGAWLIHVDTELEEVTHVPLRRTPAAFLVGDEVSLYGAAALVFDRWDGAAARS